VFEAIVQAVLGLALLYFGGELLVRGAASLARRLGLSPLAIGLTVVAFGTSAPELVVSLDAALSGAQDISVGNVVGSNVANIALVLGLAALLRPITVEAKIVRIDAPLMVFVSFAMIAVLADGHASRLEGALLAAGLASYLGFTFWEAQRASPHVRAEFASATPGPADGVRTGVLLVTGGLALLIVGARILVGSAVELTHLLGVSEAAIGLTVVAVGTSLPELATSLIATVRGHGDMAVGNAVGSNIFNVLGILGVTAIVRPLESGGVTGLDLGLMTGIACLLAAALVIRPHIDRVMGGLLLTGYLAYSSWLLIS
jgi:cation:H+ antiporter